MTFYYGRTLKNLQQYNPDILPNTGAFLPPRDKEPQSTVSPPQAIGVFKYSQKPEAGKKFAEFFLKGDNYVKFLWSTPGHAIPVLKSKLEQYRTNELLQQHPDVVAVLFKACELDVGFPPARPRGIPEPSLYWQPIRGANIIPDALQKVVLKNENPKEVLQWAEKELKRVCADFKF